MYAAPLFLQTVHDILPDNDLVPLIQLGDEQHITTAKENKKIMLVYYLHRFFWYLKNKYTQNTCIFVSHSKAIPIIQSLMYHKNNSKVYTTVWKKWSTSNNSTAQMSLLELVSFHLKMIGHM